MKKTLIAAVGIAAMFAIVPETMARHHHGNDGLRLAAGIVGLVKTAIAPAPVVVAPAPAPVVVAPAPAPAPVVVAPAPAPVVVAPAPAPVVVAPPPVVVRRPAVVHRPVKHHRPAPPPRNHGRGHRR